MDFMRAPSGMDEELELADEMARAAAEGEAEAEGRRRRQKGRRRQQSEEAGGGGGSGGGAQGGGLFGPGDFARSRTPPSKA